MPKPTTNHRRPPAHLAPPERAVWNRLVAEYGLHDAPAVLLLGELCAALAIARQAREALDRDGIYVDGKPHALTRVLNDAQKTVLATLKALQLDLEPLHAGPGRPPGMS